MKLNAGWQRRIATGACIAAALLLASCTSSQQTSQLNEEQCTSYGLEPGTTDFAACITRASFGTEYFHTYVFPYTPYYYY
jgi:hypothetical protein